MIVKADQSFRKNSILYAKRQRDVPPLYIWASATALSGIFIFFSILYYEQYNVNAWNLKRLAVFSQKSSPKKSLRIAVLGTSLTQRAFFFDDEMETFAKKKGTLPIHFIRFTLKNGDLEDYFLLFPHLLQAKLDMVFIESNVLFLERYRKFNLWIRHIKKPLRKQRRFIFQKVKYWLGLKKRMPKPNTLEMDRLVMRKSRKTQQTPHLFARYTKRVKHWKLRKDEVPRPLDTFLRTALKHNLRIGILNLSRSKKAQAVFSLKFDQQIRYYQKKYNVNSLHFPSQVRLEYYSDYAHMNSKGRHKFCHWFLQELPKLVKREKIP